MIEFACPACQHPLKLAEGLAGKRGCCPSCKNQITVPLAAAPAAPPIAVAPPAPVVARRAVPAPVEIDEERDEEPKPRESMKKSKRKKEKKPAKRPIGLFVAGGGAVAVVGLGMVVGLVWFLAGGGNKLRPVAGDPEAVLNIDREPGPGRESWVPGNAPDSANPEQWKVTADPPAPRTGELKSYIPMPAEENLSVYGCAIQPNCSQMAAFVPKTWKPDAGETVGVLEWLRYDLTKTEPIGRVLLLEGKNYSMGFSRSEPRAMLTSLSPSGQRVAVQEDTYTLKAVDVWGADGKRVGRLPIKLAGREKLRWAGFGGEDRIWMAIGAENDEWDKSLRLTQWNPATGQQTAEIKGSIFGHPSLSPGGKYLAAIAGDRLVVLNAASGAEVGSIELPGKVYGCGVCFDPTGQFLAASTADESHQANLTVSVWELATGKRTDSIYVPKGNGRYTGGVQWMSKRCLALIGALHHGAQFLDLDLHWAHGYYTQPQGKALVHGIPTPDARLWHVRKFHDFEMPKLEGKLPKAGKVTSVWGLAASSLPKEVVGPIEQARNGGFLWYPGVPCRLSLVGSVMEDKKLTPDDHRDQIIKTTADRLATMGYRLDASAPLVLEIKIDRLNNGAVVQFDSRVLKDGRVGLVRDLFPGFINDRSQTLFELPQNGAYPTLPRFMLRDAQFKRLLLPDSYSPGVDGLLDPRIEMPHPQPDPIETGKRW